MFSTERPSRTVREKACLARVLSRALLGAACLFASLQPSGCKPTAGPEKPRARQVTVGYSAPELYAAQTSIMNGFVTAAQNKGWQVHIANADNKLTQQLSQIDHFIAMRVDAIVAVPLDSRGIAPAVERARAAGIPFYTIDRAPIDCKVRMSVLSDNYLAGVQCGEYVVKALQKRHGNAKGVVLELQGDLRQNVAQLRGAGFHSVLDKHPGIRVIQRETMWRSSLHEKYTNEVLKAEEELDAIYMQSDGAGIGVVLPVLKQMGRLYKADDAKHVIVVGVDGVAETLTAIRDGYADQASSQPIPDFGILTDWMQMDFAGKEIRAMTVERPGTLWSPAELKDSPTGWVLLLRTTSVTRQNVDDPRLWGNQSMAGLSATRPGRTAATTPAGGGLNEP